MATPSIEVQAGDRSVRVTNPDKVYFPQAGITKRDLVEYYVTVGGAALRAVARRPVILKRFVDGIAEDPFFQKRAPAKRPDWISTARTALAADEKLSVVCGRRRERFPEASIYNTLTDMERDTPVGPAQSCGGDALFRNAALDAVGGYDPSVIAGEEPERAHAEESPAAGGSVLRLRRAVDAETVAAAGLQAEGGDVRDGPEELHS